jgi:hypothetical protein
MEYERNFIENTYVNRNLKKRGETLFVPSKESERLCIYVLGVSMLPHSII